MEAIEKYMLVCYSLGLGVQTVHSCWRYYLFVGMAALWRFCADRQPPRLLGKTVCCIPRPWKGSRAHSIPLPLSDTFPHFFTCLFTITEIAFVSRHHSDNGYYGCYVPNMRSLSTDCNLKLDQRPDLRPLGTSRQAQLHPSNVWPWTCSPSVRQHLLLRFTNHIGSAHQTPNFQMWCAGWTTGPPFLLQQFVIQDYVQKLARPYKEHRRSIH